MLTFFSILNFFHWKSKLTKLLDAVYGIGEEQTYKILSSPFQDTLGSFTK